MPGCPKTEDADRWLARGREPALDEVLGEPMLSGLMTPRTARLLRLAAMLVRLRESRQAA